MPPAGVVVHPIARAGVIGISGDADASGTGARCAVQLAQPSYDRTEPLGHPNGLNDLVGDGPAGQTGEFPSRHLVSGVVEQLKHNTKDERLRRGFDHSPQMQLLDDLAKGFE